VIVAHTRKLRFLALLPTVFKGEHVQHAGVEVLRGATVEIAASRPFTMYADGDPIAELPVTVRALPGAVRILTPQRAS
jgi:diacylglycerol kinase family enzyme